MASWAIDPLLGQVARLFLAALLLASALQKARKLGSFVGVVAAYRLLPAGLVRVAAGLLPLAEAVGAAALLFPPVETVGAGMAGALFMLFFAAIAINLGRGRTIIDCGCTFAGRGGGLSVWHLARLGLLIGLAGVAGMKSAGRPLQGFDHVNALAALVALVVLYLVTETLLANHTWMRTRNQERESTVHA